jgi:hypothetical protein
MPATATAETPKLAASTATADHLDQHAGQARPTDPGELGRDLKLRIALDEGLVADEVREVGLVGDVEEDREDSGEECHDVELQQGEPPEPVGDRDAPVGHEPSEVREDHHRALGESVDPGPRRKPDE